MRKSRRSGVVSGITLITIGLLLFWMNRADNLTDGLVFFVVGSVFLGAYLYSRNYGLLIPACILLGLGAGSVIPDSRLISEPWTFGLGAGFVAIYVIALLYERRSHMWPLIPGSILLLQGLSVGDEVIDFLFDDGGWALVLVAIGVFILIGTFSRKRRTDEGTD